MNLTRRTVVVGMGAVGSLAGMPAFAAAPPANRQVPFFYRVKVGDVEVTALNDGYFPAPVGNFTGGIDPQKAKDLAAREHMTLTDRVPIPINTFVINTKDKLYLIDTGIGGKFAPALGNLPHMLRAAGYEPDQVDAILMTHLHIDHAGGLLTKEGAAVFPKAELIVSDVEYKYWTDPSFPAAAPERQRGMVPVAVNGLAAYRDRTTRFADNADVVKGIKSMPLPGHTPGHTGFVISDGADQLFVWGDIVHSAFLQCANPTWGYNADVDGAQAIATRQATFKRAAAEKTFVAGMHLPFPGFGHVVTDGQAYRFVPAPWRPQV